MCMCAFVLDHGQVKRMDLEDKEEDHRLEISRLQAEVSAAVSRLEAQGESREKVRGHIRTHTHNTHR